MSTFFLYCLLYLTDEKLELFDSLPSGSQHLVVFEKKQLSETSYNPTKANGYLAKNELATSPFYSLARH
jgi:hypothetical protein